MTLLAKARPRVIGEPERLIGEAALIRQLRPRDRITSDSIDEVIRDYEVALSQDSKPK